MFPSFSGNTRPRRQVNLSGRSNNPFASPGSRISSSPLAGHNAVAHAQQERILRQQERERPPAAIKIQKTWRGHRSRKEVQEVWRWEWDHIEDWSTTKSLPDTADPYASAGQCLASLRLLVQFASVRDEQDVQRLDHFASRYLHTESTQLFSLAQIGAYSLLCLAKLTLSTLRTKRTSPLSSRLVDQSLKVLHSLATLVPVPLSFYSRDYFKTLAKVAAGGENHDQELLQAAVLAILRPVTRDSVIYQSLVTELLTMPELPAALGGLKGLAHGIKYELLADAIHKLLSPTINSNILHRKNREDVLWLLAYFIYFRRSAYSDKHRNEKVVPDALYVKIISRLISFLADDIGTRIDTSIDGTMLGDERLASSTRSPKPLPAFVRSEILTLITQENVSSLLANIDALPEGADNEGSSEAAALASYALTLLRAFPRRGDEIRLWLYRGSTSSQSRTGQNSETLPAIKYFYQAASKTKVFVQISKDSRETVYMLRPEKAQNADMTHSSYSTREAKDQQWRVILLFLELYTFVLKVMDDEEFLSGTSETNEQWSWTRQSALPIDQVKELTLFLKNLAFAMYWNASEIAGIEATEAKTSLAEYFGSGRAPVSERTQNEAPASHTELSVAGVSGMSLAYMKDMVTGVLRMVYERDSRRRFLPQGHWLMTKYFEMDRFIAAVVIEEEEKHKIEESYDVDGEIKVAGDTSESDEDEDDRRYLVGTQHTQNVRNAQRLQRQQRKTARRKYLESVTPRLEILQNMPFFIPFSTRVQIFRQFVALDQIRRRGTADPDEWRFAMMNTADGNIMGRHRAKVRRKYIFDDAYAEFYELGEGLKEPIQIRFVDEFDTVEEGIDGGGVTKEFLTSVTNEAFTADNGMESLFVENDQHLLYPNPAAIEERKFALQQAFQEEGRSFPPDHRRNRQGQNSRRDQPLALPLSVQGSADWNENIRDLLRRYEFLGRIMGKCLYEGILVDIHFAPFFLLKWALTGGSGSATRESGYRANLNDLRDLDEGLYQGLLQLKNYPGNVEDFSLNFAVTDTIRTSPTESRSITRELRPGGSSISVTNENRLVYISYIARHRLQIQPHLQTSAFLRGLGAIVSTSWLSMFNQSELQTLVGGSSSEVSVSDLRANTQYGGLYAVGDDGLEHPCVAMFWKVMQDMDDADRKKVLKFVTSTPRAPLLGFGNLNPRFSIRDSGNDQTRLPSTSTCVNLLKLPVYRDEKVLRERLLYSVNSGAGFNLS